MYVAHGTVSFVQNSITLNTAQSGSNVVGSIGWGMAGTSQGGGLFIDSTLLVRLDSLTLAHLLNNTAASNPNIQGRYTLTS